jgi:hypothetical protein
MAEFLSGARHERQQGKIATRNFRSRDGLGRRPSVSVCIAHRKSGLLDVVKLLLRCGADSDIDPLNKTGPKKINQLLSTHQSRRLIGRHITGQDLLRALLYSISEERDVEQDHRIT